MAGQRARGCSEFVGVWSVAENDPSMLDLSRWESIEAALDELELRGRAFEDALAPYLQAHLRDADGALTIYLLFVMSAATRSRGLQEAIVREIRQTNPHAVFPLMRTLLETAALCFYVSDHPDYAEVLTDEQRNRAPGSPSRKSPQALVDYMDRQGHTDHLGRVYRQLCEITHFGHLAMWAAHEIEDDAERRTSWSSAPRFRGDTGLIACGQLDEMTTLMTAAIERLGQRLLALHGSSL